MDLVGEMDKPEKLVPTWRVDLLSDVELGRLFSGRPKVRGHSARGLEIELTYGFGQRPSLSDWTSDKPERQLKALPDGSLQVPSDAKIELKAPMAVPVSLEVAFKIGRTPDDHAFAVAVLDGEDGRVSADSGRDALLQIRHKTRHRTGRAKLRTDKGASERFLLSIIPKGHQTTAELVTVADKTKPLELPKDMKLSGKVWLRALGEGAVLNGLRVRGVVPRDWMIKALTEQ